MPKLPSCTRKNAWKSQWKFCISANSCIFEWMNQLASSGQSLDANFGGEFWFIIKVYFNQDFQKYLLKVFLLREISVLKMYRCCQASWCFTWMAPLCRGCGGGGITGAVGILRGARGNAAATRLGAGLLAIAATQHGKVLPFGKPCGE